jgi:hypothetical protein
MGNEKSAQSSLHIQGYIFRVDLTVAGKLEYQTKIIFICSAQI